MKQFRFDDVCINADMKLIRAITDYIYETIKEPVKVIYGVSPMVHRMNTGDSVKDQRVFPEIMNAFSDYRRFYKVEMAGIPEMDNRVVLAGHGLIHVDHRLLDKGAQELSIIASCSLVGAGIFIPPFNKYNDITEIICRENDIELVKFEDGWKSCEFNSYKKEHDRWYLHAREWTLEKFTQWMK